MLAEARQAVDVDGMASASEAPGANVGPKSTRQPSFYETETEVTCCFVIRGSNEETFKFKFDEHSFTIVEGKRISGRMWFTPPARYTLVAAIVPGECTVQYMTKKVKVKLKKRVAGVQWNSLEKIDRCQPTPLRDGDSAKNWDRIGMCCVRARARASARMLFGMASTTLSTRVCLAACLGFRHHLILALTTLPCPFHAYVSRRGDAEIAGPFRRQQGVHMPTL